MSWEKIFRLSNSNQCCLEPYKKKCCFTIGNTMAKQNAGIHKGIDPALFWANLFLYLLESKYIQQHFHSDPQDLTGVMVNLDSKMIYAQ